MHAEVKNSGTEDRALGSPERSWLLRISMPRYLKKWLAVYDDEIALFGWTALLLFLLSGSSIILSNFAETAFLKRFGIKYLPLIYMLNAAITFVIMGLLAGVMAQIGRAHV